MKIEAKIQKWGNGLAIRISGAMRDIPGFKEGTCLSVDITEDGLDIRKLPEKNAKLLPFSESELIAALTPHTAHAEIIAKPLPGEY